MTVQHKVFLCFDDVLIILHNTEVGQYSCGTLEQQDNCNCL